MQHPITEILRVGTVVTKAPDSMHCRVLFPDTPTNPVTSYWLPVLVNRAMGDTYYDMPDIGDNVLCAFLPNGMEAGFILGSYYPEKKAPCTDENVYQHKFKDGTYIEYDRNSHKLTASCVGDANISAEGTLNLRAEHINIIGNSTVNIQGAQVNIQE